MCASGSGFEPFKANGKALKSAIVATYDYVDEYGELLFQVQRKQPKGFIQRRPDGTAAGSDKLGDTRRVLYRLPELLEAVASEQPIFIAEGEKDVEALVKLGVIGNVQQCRRRKMARRVFKGAPRRRRRDLSRQGCRRRGSP